MLNRFLSACKRFKTSISRERFLVWLFGLSNTLDTSHGKGLILLQIDGLSRAEFVHALAKGTMPFVRRLYDSEDYKLHSVFSGVPSSTPAVQGELFYGVKACVPAFRFQRPQDTAPVIMLEQTVARDIQKSLEEQGEPLLRGGSAFCDMFDGGAEEASFCASSLGWSSLIPTGNTFKMIVFAVLHSASVVRVVLLTIIEFILSMVDVIRGVISGHSFVRELSFIPVRLATAVLLRELATIGVKLDVARGLPVIHANFLGYDEQSHRRGPRSRFAHWSLKGIDRAIERIVKSTARADRRDYSVWIYSDHGQEPVSGYPVITGRTIHQAVNKVLLRYVRKPEPAHAATMDDPLSDPHYQYAYLLGSKKLNHWLRRWTKGESYTTFVEFSMAAMGPLGFVYLKQALTPSVQAKIAHDLVHQARVPMVIVATRTLTGVRSANIWTKQGVYTLPKDKVSVLGGDHPFVDGVSTDLIELAHHEFSGDFILSGWQRGEPTVSFRTEHGAHAGPGINETDAFALLPIGSQLPLPARGYHRFSDLYQLARSVIATEET